MRRIPPIAALRAFVAAAHAKSFTRAGEELNLTQAAVSYQIRQLERDLGVTLFRRGRRELALTRAARAYLPAVRQALTLLTEAASGLDGAESDGALTVSATQSLTARWLAQRIRRYVTDYPDNNVKIDATDTVIDFSIAEVDLAVRYARSVDPELDAVRLTGDLVFPVCSPALMEDGGPIERPEDLKSHTLLHDGMTDITWRDWLAAAGAPKVADQGVVFSHTGPAIEAALAGQGAALGRGLLVADDLASGRLVRPLPLAVASSYAYFAVCPPSAASTAKISTFRAWLATEAAASTGSINP